jgi:hypothetical protein
LGRRNTSTQRAKNQTRHRHARSLEPSPRHVLSPTRRTNGLPPTHRVQQAHPQNRQRRQRNNGQRRLHTLWSTKRTIHTHRRQYTRHRKTSHTSTPPSTTTKRDTRNTPTNNLHITRINPRKVTETKQCQHKKPRKSLTCKENP